MDNLTERILNIILLIIPMFVYFIISLSIIGKPCMTFFFLLLISSFLFHLIGRVRRRLLQNLYENFRKELRIGIMNCSEMFRLRSDAYYSLNKILSDVKLRNFKEHHNEHYMRIVSSFKSYNEIVRYTSLITPLSLSLILSLIVFMLPPTSYNMLNLALFTLSLSFAIAILLIYELRRGEYNGLSDIISHLRDAFSFVKELRELINLGVPLPKALYIECSRFHVTFDPLNVGSRVKHNSSYDLLIHIVELSQEIGSVSVSDLKAWLEKVEMFMSRVYESLSKLYAESKISSASHLVIFLILGLTVGCMLGVWPVFSQVVYNYNVQSSLLTLSIFSTSLLVNLIETFLSNIGLNKFSLLATLLSIVTSIIVSNVIWCFFM